MEEVSRVKDRKTYGTGVPIGRGYGIRQKARIFSFLGAYSFKVRRN